MPAAVRIGVVKHWVSLAIGNIGSQLSVLAEGLGIKFIFYDVETIAIG